MPDVAQGRFLSRLLYADGNGADQLWTWAWFRPNAGNALSRDTGSSTMPDAKPASGSHAHRSVAGRLVRVLIAVLLVMSVGLAAAVSLAALASLAAAADQGTPLRPATGSLSQSGRRAAA
jgi:hypothetical protein